MGSTISILCVTNCLSTAGPVLTYSATDSTLTIKGLFTGTYKYVAAGSTITFQVTGFINPSIHGAYFFSVTSYETTGSSAALIDTISSLYVSIAELSIITIKKVAPLYLTQLIPWFRFKLQSAIDIDTTYTLTITFPSTF
jgi:hypothetical protein